MLCSLLFMDEIGLYMFHVLIDSFSMNSCTYVYACSIIVSYIFYACDNFQVHDSFHVNHNFVGFRWLHLLKHN
jgi:hypothetical protein